MKLLIKLSILLSLSTILCSNNLHAQCEEYGVNVEPENFIQRSYFRYAFEDKQQADILRQKATIETNRKKIQRQVNMVDTLIKQLAVTKAKKDQKYIQKKLDESKDSLGKTCTNIFIAANRLVKEYYISATDSAILYSKVNNTTQATKYKTEGNKKYNQNLKEIEKCAKLNIDQKLKIFPSIVRVSFEFIEAYENAIAETYDDSPSKRTAAASGNIKKKELLEREKELYKIRTDSILRQYRVTKSEHTDWFTKLSTEEKKIEDNLLQIDRLQIEIRNMEDKLELIDATKPENRFKAADLTTKISDNVFTIKNLEKQNAGFRDAGLKTITQSIAKEYASLELLFNTFKSNFSSLNRAGTNAGLQYVQAIEDSIYSSLNEARKCIDIAVFFGKCLPPKHIVYFNLVKANLIIYEIGKKIEIVPEEYDYLFKVKEPFLLNCGTTGKENPNQHNNPVNLVNSGNKGKTSSGGNKGKTLPQNNLGIIFKVQLFVTDQIAPTSTFKGLNPVSSERTDEGNIAYFAGKFKNYQQAQDYLKTVQNTGFSKAFIVANDKDGKRIKVEDALKAIENGVPNTIKIIDEGNNKKTEITNNTKIKANENVSATDISTTKGQIYTVQIAAGDNIPSNADVKMLSPLFVEKDGSIYKYMYGNYSKIEDAKKQRNAIVKLGIKDAFVVSYKNGKRVQPDEKQ